MAKSKKDTEFYVRLENIQLSDAAVASIESGIQGLIMSELVGYKPNPDDPNPPKGRRPPIGGPIIIRPPRPWPGLIARKLLPKDIQTLGIKENLVDIQVKGL